MDSLHVNFRKGGEAPTPPLLNRQHLLSTNIINNAMNKQQHMVKLLRVGKDAVNETLYAKKIRPNDPCPCGSGLKAKKCCGTDTQYLYRTKKKENPENQEGSTNATQSNN